MKLQLTLLVHCCWFYRNYGRQEFSYGVEFILLIAFVGGKFSKAAEDALASLAKLTLEFPSLIVQSTGGLFEFENVIWQFSFK